MTSFLIAGSVFLLAGTGLHAQERDTRAGAGREVEAPPKVKTKSPTQPGAPAPSVQRDSTAKPAVPRKSKSAAATASRQQRKLPRVEKAAKPSA